MTRTNRPPRASSSNSVRLMMASAAIAPPIASEPVSPMKIWAGEVFHHRNPKTAPAQAAGEDSQIEGISNL